MNYKNTALILEGGGFRGIFTAGILEVFLENNLFFENIYGVSAGAAYGVSYASKQIGRNLEVNEIINDKRYCSWYNWLKKGSMFDWDFVYGEVPKNIIPFDFETFFNSESQFYAVTTNCLNGLPEYYLLNNKNTEEFKTILAASSSLPFVSPPVKYDHKILMDGGISDSIPFEYALRNGSKRAVLILTQLKDYVKGPLKMAPLFKWYLHKYPKVYELMQTRYQKYNNDLKSVMELEAQGKLFVVRPPKHIEVRRIENNPQKTVLVYDKAKKQAEVELPKLLKWLQN